MELANYLFGSFLILAITNVIVHLLLFKVFQCKKDEINNAIFLDFQHRYLAVYLLALLADWLQGPYLYKLYSHYGFLESQITVLYVCGFATSVVFATLTTVLVERVGRKKLCLTFTVLYSLTCCMKLSRSYGVLVVARVFGGISTSLLFTAFEAWYAYEHIEVHDFPTDWINATFDKATLWNGILAVAAGLVADLFADVLGLGPVAPFLLAVPLLAAVGFVVATRWPENRAKRKLRFSATCLAGLRAIVTNEIILVLGVIQSLFESVMYIFVFLWTPVLDSGGHDAVPLGVVFASFMLCIILGSNFFRMLSFRKVPAQFPLLVALALATGSVLMNAIATQPAHEIPTLSLNAFYAFEVACGLYFPAMSFLRSKLVPESQRSEVLNWFRVPVNIIACVLLMYLHGIDDRSGSRKLFFISSALMSVALAFGLRLAALMRRYNSGRYSLTPSNEEDSC